MNYKKLRNISINKTLVAQVIFVVVVVGVFLVLERLFVDDFGSKSRNFGEATLLVDFDNMRRMFEGEVADGMTILDALNVSAEAGKIKLRYVIDYDNRTTVTEINDHVALGKSFSFLVNGKFVKTEDLNKKTVKSGDEITIRLQ
ncbi:MAG: hypothetical protein AAB799_01125 [Patescibacteria group bacterium]